MWSYRLGAGSRCRYFFAELGGGTLAFSRKPITFDKLCGLSITNSVFLSITNSVLLGFLGKGGVRAKKQDRSGADPRAY